MLQSDHCKAVGFCGIFYSFSTTLAYSVVKPVCSSQFINPRNKEKHRILFLSVLIFISIKPGQWSWPVVLTSGTWLNYNPYYQFECWNPCYPHEFSGKALVRARCEGPWVRKIGYLRIQGILVLNKISVIPYARPPLHESRGEILHFKHPCLLAVNRIASRTFREKNPHQSRVFFFPTKF